MHGGRLHRGDTQTIEKLGGGRLHRAYIEVGACLGQYSTHLSTANEGVVVGKEMPILHPLCVYRYSTRASNK